MAQITLNSTGVASSGSLVLQTNGTTTAATIDTAQNFGLGVTPSANAGVSTLNIANYNRTFSALTLGSNANSAGYIGYNMGNTSTSNTWKYISADTGSALYFAGNEYRFMQFASGSAGATTSGTQAMTLDASGNLGIGETNPAFRLDVANTQAVLRVRSTTGTNPVYLLTTNGGGDFYFGRENSTGSTFGSNTGYASVLYSAGAYPIVFLPNGTEKMRLDSSGNLGLGVTPSAWAATNPIKAIQVGRGGSISYGNDSASTNIVAGAYLSATGQWTKIGTVASAKLALSDYDGSFVWSRAGSGSGNFTYTDVMTLDTNGNLLVGKTSFGGTATGGEIGANGVVNSYSPDTTNSSSTFAAYSNGASAYRFYVGWGGTIFATSTTITAISDQRLKENIRDLDDGLASVMALKPRKFDWKEGKGANIKDARGFIAQEFEAVFPDMIDEWRDPAPEGEEPYKAINANLIPTLVKAIQELKAEFDAYKASHP